MSSWREDNPILELILNPSFQWGNRNLNHFVMKRQSPGSRDKRQPRMLRSSTATPLAGTI